MIGDKYKLLFRPGTELSEWISGYELRNARYIASIKKLMDRNESSARKHELTHTVIAILYLAVMIAVIALAN